jgi:aspartate-semialdehyde dehydrogenase
LFSHTTSIGANGYNEEEMKLTKETKKIWGVRALLSAALPLACTARGADDDQHSPLQT